MKCALRISPPLLITWRLPVLIVPEMEARLKQHNIQFRRGQVPSLGIAQLFFKDPAGNGIELSFAEDQA